MPNIVADQPIRYRVVASSTYRNSPRALGRRRHKGGTGRTAPDHFRSGRATRTQKGMDMTEELRPMHSPEYLPGAPAGVTGTYAQGAVDTGDVLPGENIAPAYRTTAPASPSVMPPLNEGDTSTTGVAKEQAGQGAGTAKQAGTQVAGAVKEQAAEVTAEAGRQVKQLLSQTQSELTDQ